jgi:hypothetical protein
MDTTNEKERDIDNKTDKPEATQPSVTLENAPSPTRCKQLCVLCSCEGVRGTRLCNEHLEGYSLAVQILLSKRQHRGAALLCSDWRLTQ